jgi:hypothetical protein
MFSSSINKFYLIYLIIGFSSTTIFSSFKLKASNHNNNLKPDIKSTEIKELNLDFRFKYNTTELLTKQDQDSSKGLSLIIRCSKINCLNGNCIDKDTCVCQHGYSTYNFTDGEYKIKDKDKIEKGVNDKRFYCDYKMKSQIVAFLLEVGFILGIGHIYLGRILHGLLKMNVILLFLFLDIFIKNKIGNKSLKSKNMYYNFSLFCYICIILFHLVDIVMMGLNKYNDGYGMRMYYEEIPH